VVLGCSIINKNGVWIMSKIECGLDLRLLTDALASENLISLKDCSGEDGKVRTILSKVMFRGNLDPMRAFFSYEVFHIEVVDGILEILIQEPSK
jgi:hypothetical protein